MSSEMRTSEGHYPASPVDAARLAIWRLFQQGYVDEDMATAGLLAVDLGTRRKPRAGQPDPATAADRTEPRGRRHAA
jgi:hypothetical protein